MRLITRCIFDHCVAITMLLMVVGQSATNGQEAAWKKVPIIEQEPFDLIQLDERNKNVVLQIRPLDNPIPEPIPADGYLVFEAPKLSDERLEVPYQAIIKYRSYIQLLQEEANEHIRKEEFGQAFRNLIYIYDHGGKNDPRVQRTIQNLLFRDGTKNYLDGSFELALTIFQDIYERDPNFEVEGISKRPIDLILDSQDKNILSKFNAGKFALVRAAIDAMELRYGDAAKPIADKWRRRLLDRSNEMLAEARQIASQGNGKLAHLNARRANSVLPGRPEAKQLFQEIVQQFPIVFVGVSERVEESNPLSLDNWGARRIGKLTQRSVVEFKGPGDDGGKYEFINGSIKQLDDDGFIFRFTIEPEKSTDSAPPFDAYEFSRRLIARGTVGNEEYHVPFAKIVHTIEIEDEFNIVIKLSRAFVRPEALFQFLYDSPVPNGPYVMTEKNDEVMVFERNERYESPVNAQNPQIIEWQLPSSSQAVDALINGEIDVVDRISLSDISRLQADAAIKVGSYIVPTVHMLVPNQRNEFMSDRTFRNGLKQGLNRELILKEIICGGQEISGCELLSGPFPVGTEENDQVSYGYNISVVPQPFNDLLGMVLTQVVLETRKTMLMKQGEENPSLEFPTIVLAHTSDEIAETASLNIQQMWEAMGLSVVLRKLDVGQTIPNDDDWDFLYYAISMEEPLTNAELLFGRDGVVETVSAPIEQNMQKLGYSQSWQMAGKTLRRLHRQAANDLAVIPLWQIQDHFAYRKNLTGIGKNPVHLYENVEFWRIRSEAKED